MVIQIRSFPQYDPYQMLNLKSGIFLHVTAILGSIGQL